MGMFMSLSAVIGKTQTEVTDCMGKYARALNGAFSKEERSTNDNGTCIMAEANGNTAVVYPDDFYRWDECTEFLSRELKTPVFSCHIHDGDLWMYVLYYNGVIVDQYNPMPGYWDDSLATHEIEEWAGSAATVVSYVPGLATADIDKYLVRWDVENEDADMGSAYAGDEYQKEDYQLFDFLRKIGLPLTIAETGKPIGQTYLLTLKDDAIRLQPETEPTVTTPVAAKPAEQAPIPPPATSARNKPADKPWWKLW